MGDSGWTHGLTTEQLAQIGVIVVACAQLEALARMAVGMLAGMNIGVQQAVLSGHSQNRVLDMIKKLSSRLPDSSLTQRWRDWATEANRVAEERNAVLHALWPTGEVGIEMARRRTNAEPVNIPYEDVGLRALESSATELLHLWTPLIVETSETLHSAP